MQAWRQTTRWSMRALSRQKLDAESSRQLVQDASHRLQGQAYFLDQLQEDLKENDEVMPNGIIKASNNSVSSNLLDWKGHLEREKEEQRALHQADIILRNLHVLHRDTVQLTQHLLQSENIWSSFTNAHQSTLAATMEQIRSRHATTLETVADLVLLLRDYRDLPHAALTSLLRGRLSVQLLCDHYVGLQKGRQNGGVSVNCPLQPVLEEAVTEAKHLCEAHYQESPEIILPKDYPAPLTLIRPWLHHALVEMLKNSMVASMEISEKPPPIEIEVQEIDGGFVSIHIHDYGSGFDGDPFTFASSPDKWDRLDVQQSYATVRSPLSSLGVGVPSSLWLLQHFGGNLELSNRDQRGCTATLVLPLDDDLPEYLPTMHSTME
jgi:pyruvate dehydrogenase kinase 2/3/4